MQRNSADILVTGATGRIGTILRRSWPAGRAIWQARRERAGFAAIDPADAAACAAVTPQGGAILALAGVVGARADGADGAGEFDANVDLALAAVRAGASAGARVFLASSAAVYGRPEGPLAEDAPLAPVSDYGRSKARMEAEAGNLGARLGVSVTSLRIGNIAGLDAILGGWRPGFQLDRFADGRTPRRSYIGLGVLSDTLLALIRTQGHSALNVAQPGPVEMGDLLDAAGLGWTARTPDPGAIPDVTLSSNRLQTVLAKPLAPARAQDLVAQWRALGHQAAS